MAPPPTGPIKSESFISGGLFELTEAQWDAVWTASDPDRGLGSGLLPGYSYYLSDVPGTFFLINKTGAPPVAPGNWLTNCFVALSSTTALIQISDPRQNQNLPGTPGLVVAAPQAGSFNATIGNLYPLTGDEFVATLPTALASGNGALIGFKIDSGGAIGWAVVPNAADTIDGDADGKVLIADESYVVLISDGIATWRAIANLGAFV